jgi:hypothetical protein
LLLCHRVITVNPALVTRDNPGQEGCIVGGDMAKLLADFNTAAVSDQLSEISSGLIYDTK